MLFVKNRFIISALTIFLWQSLRADFTPQAQYKWHSYAYAGYAWSLNAGIVNPDPAVFANVAPGDNDNATLSNTSYGGVALHHNFNEWYTLGFSFESYGAFTYQRFHTNGNPMLEYLGPNYLREFLMDHQAAMIEAHFKFPAELAVFRHTLKIAPVCGVGVGVGINNLYNFATISLNPNAVGTQFTSIANNNISKSFAWRIEAGVNFASLESNVSFGVSYRYDDGGEFASGTLYEFASGQDALTYLPAWRGRLKTNQIKMYINVNFD
jgi:hypothetical protein